MKNVRTMKIEELTKEQILAARRRRSRERCAEHRSRCTWVALAVGALCRAAGLMFVNQSKPVVISLDQQPLVLNV